MAGKLESTKLKAKQVKKQIKLKKHEKTKPQPDIKDLEVT